MPRIRTIKPELWQDEKLAALPALPRLVFIGLISMADDAGRLVDNVKSIDGFIFPETDDSAKEALTILATLSRVFRYVAPNGQKVIQIVNWARHQKVDHPNKYVLPAPPPEAIAAARFAPTPRESREILATVSRNPLATTPTSTGTPTSTTDREQTTAAALARRQEAPTTAPEPPVTEGQVLATVRKVLWAPDGDPPADDGTGKPWTEAREMTVIQALVKKGETLPDLIRVCHGLRLLQDQGEVDWLTPGKVTLRTVYYTKNGSRSMLTQALDAYAAGPPKATSPPNGRHPIEVRRADFLAGLKQFSREAPCAPSAH